MNSASAAHRCTSQVSCLFDYLNRSGMPGDDSLFVAKTIIERARGNTDLNQGEKALALLKKYDLLEDSMTYAEEAVRIAGQVEKLMRNCGLSRARASEYISLVCLKRKTDLSYSEKQRLWNLKRIVKSQAKQAVG